MKRLAAFVFAMLALQADGIAREPCRKYGEVQEFTGPVLPIDVRRGGKATRFWVLRLPQSICVDGGTTAGDIPEKNVRELQLAFQEGSPYYGIYRSMVDGRARFRVTGALVHSRAAQPARSVALRVEDFVPRSAH